MPMGKASGQKINFEKSKVFFSANTPPSRRKIPLHSFNLAMLWKQGWRFISNKDTMVFKVFKAKYFPKEDFLDANLGKIPVMFGVVFMFHGLL